MRIVERLSAPAVALALACFAVFLLRAAAFSKQDFLLGYDSANYAVVAANIADGRGFTVDFVLNHLVKYDGISHPEDRRLSINSLLIAGIFLLMGKSAFSAKLLNIALGSIFIPLTVYVLARTMALPRSVGLLAGLSAALVHNLSEQTYTAMADLLFTQLFLLFILAMVRSARDPRWHSASGILIGFAFLAKTQGLILFPLWVASLLAGGKGSWTSEKRYLALGSILSLAMMSPFLVRNQILFGDPLYTTIRYNAPYDHLFDTNPLGWLERYLKVYWDAAPAGYFSGFSGRSAAESAGIMARQVCQAFRLIGPGFLILPLLTPAVWRSREQRAVLMAVLGYILLISVFFAFHDRYEMPLVPLLLLLTWSALHHLVASTAWRAFPGGSAGLRAVSAGICLSLLFAVIHYGDMENFRRELVQKPFAFQKALIDTARWAKQNLPPTAVVMTHDPPLFNFYSGLKAVQIPYDGAEALARVVSHYGVTHAIPWTVDADRYRGIRGNRSLAGNINILELDPSIPYANLYRLVRERNLPPLYSSGGLGIYALATGQKE